MDSQSQAMDAEPLDLSEYVQRIETALEGHEWPDVAAKQAVSALRPELEELHRLRIDIGER